MFWYYYYDTLVYADSPHVRLSDARTQNEITHCNQPYFSQVTGFSQSTFSNLHAAAK